MISLYRLLTYAGSTVVVPALFVRSIIPGGAAVRLRERLGRIDSLTGSSPRIWLQAVSVGEVRTAETLVTAMRKRDSTLRLALSSTTPSGLELACDLKRRTLLDADPFAFPLDLPSPVRRALDAIRPAAYGSVETEIWPGLFGECARRSIPLFIVNGSISDRSAKRYRLIGGAVAEALGKVGAACVQSGEDAARIAALGVRPERVIVTGNIKFDSHPANLRERASALRHELGIPAGSRVIIAGSTAPGEEAIVVRAFILASVAAPGLTLVVAPRHKERFDEAAAAMAAEGVTVIRRSAPRNAAAGGPRAILLDTMGELEAAYGVAEVAFVGGSLRPRGGQNPLEPARLGVPVFFGPGMDNFREVAAALVAAGGAFVVRDAQELATGFLRLLRDDGARVRASEAARSFVVSHAGATARTLRALARLIPEVFDGLGESEG